MDKLTTEFAEYICDEICTKIQGKSEDDAAEICDCCKIGGFICKILNKYNQDSK